MVHVRMFIGANVLGCLGHEGLLVDVMTISVTVYVGSEPKAFKYEGQCSFLLTLHQFPGLFRNFVKIVPTSWKIIGIEHKR